MSSKLGMSYAQAEEAATLIERYGKRIQDEVVALKGALARDISWEGKGRSGYNAMQAELDAAAHEFGNAVITAADVVRRAQQEIDTADKTVENFFLA